MQSTAALAWADAPNLVSQSHAKRRPATTTLLSAVSARIGETPSLPPARAACTELMRRCLYEPRDAASPISSGSTRCQRLPSWLWRHQGGLRARRSRPETLGTGTCGDAPRATCSIIAPAILSFFHLLRRQCEPEARVAVEVCDTLKAETAKEGDARRVGVGDAGEDVTGAEFVARIPDGG
jgi:hypothetical protein